MFTAFKSYPRIIRIICCVLFFTCCAVCSYGFLSATNNLASCGGKWLPEKITGMRQPRFSFNHFLLRRALPSNRLDLSFWNGAQKITFFRPVDCKRVVFDIELGQGAFAGVLFGGHNDRFFGVMFSRGGIYPDMFFELDRDGFFVSTQKLDMPGAQKQNRFDVELLFKHNRVSVFVNNAPVARHAWGSSVVGKGSFGFIGGLKPAFVDNIKIYEADGKVITENFFNKSGGIKFFAGSCACVLVLVCLAVFFLRRIRFFAKLQHVYLVVWVLLCFLLLSVGVVACDFKWMVFNRGWFVLDPYGDFQEIAAYGPAPAMALKRTEPFEPAYSKQFLLKVLDAQNADEPPEGVLRIVVLGTSQTFGMGVVKDSEPFPAILQAELNKNRWVMCRVFNYGLAGSFSGDITELYLKKWIRKKPEICIVNLSNNDFRGEIGLERKTGTTPAVFALNLEKIVRANTARGIKTVLCLEANSPEASPEELEYHKIMRKLAERKKLLCIDLHKHLRENIGQGILWWDHVHMTPAGHKMSGKFIAEQILPVVKSTTLGKNQEDF